MSLTLYDMDKMCNKSDLNDLNTTITNADDVKQSLRCESPVFRCVHHKPIRGVRSDSSDYDVPSYQINKSRTSSKCENETAELVLPFTPVFSPIPVSSLQFQPPSIHTLGTVAKRISLGQTFKNSNGSDNEKKTFGVFESLGMCDKDISWASSMASPTPAAPGTGFNTIERATFFPEEKFQNIQPRALFSPTHDDDFGCKPLTFSSESEDDGSYKTNIRLSDVCATLKQLEVKSLEPVQKTHEEQLIFQNTPTSPVINTKKKKSESVKKKKKGILVKSPQIIDKYEFSVDDSVPKLTQKFIEDDSFQSISFSGIDELCKTLVSTTDSSAFDCEKTLVDIESDSVLQPNIQKHFYPSKTKADVYEVSLTDNLHSYAQALEHGDMNIMQGKKMEKSLTEKGIVRFDTLDKVDATKRLHSELSGKKDSGSEKKFKNDDNWEEMKMYLSESQLNVSDSEIFRTVENLEKSLAIDDKWGSQDATKNSTLVSDGERICVSGVKGLMSKEKFKEGTSENARHATETNEQVFHNTSTSEFCEKPLMEFTTASGSKLSVSEKALIKANKVFKECDENRGFSTGSSKTMKISSEALEKAKALMFDDSSNLMKTIKVSSKALERAKVLMTDERATKGYSKIQVSTKALEKAKALMSDFDEKLIEPKPGIHLMRGFSTGLGRTIQVSSKALEKATALIFECEDGFTGFATVSSKTVKISPDALEKSKAVKSKCDDSCNLTKPINMSPEGLEKAKALMSGCHQNESSMDAKLIKGSATVCKPGKEEVPGFVGFSASLVDEMKVTSEALEKAEAFMFECDEEVPSNDVKLIKATTTASIPKGVVFSTASGTQIKVSSGALEKARALMSDCDQNETSKAVKITKASKTISKPGSEKVSGFMGFSTALGNQVKVTSETLEKAKALMSEIDVNFKEVDESLASNWKKYFPTTPREGSAGISFSTAGGSQMTVSEPYLAKARESAMRWEQPEDSTPTSSTASVQKEIPPNTEEPSGITETVLKPTEWDEIIPSWLHVYSTSPSIAADRIDLSPVVSHEDGGSSKLDREYIVKSPVLSSSDRFYKKIKRKKLRFEDCPNVPDTKTRASGFIVPYNSAGKKKSMKRTSSNLSLDFSAPFKKAKPIEEVAKERCLDVREERARATAEQEKAARDKEKVKPLVGSHLMRKQSERQMTWMEAVGKSSPEVHSIEFLKSWGVKKDIISVNIGNAVDFKFDGLDLFGSSCLTNIHGYPVGDGCLIIPNEENKFGFEEFKRSFLASPGVQPNLLPEGWVENHYKWIIWKLAHYEKSFPLHFGGKCLTPNNVMLQLKYRYDREIDRSERSALKKILERDDTSVKRMVLCVCGVRKVTNADVKDYELTLTDGWYSCPARVDPAMGRLIEAGKLSVGTKLVMQGASLVNCEQGTSPLELNSEVYLKISTNSTRRIRWDTKLGFQKNPENFAISLGSILPQGGPISRLDVIIVRIYPMLYKERTSDGQHVTRNLRSEEKAEAEYRKIQERRLEVIWSEVQSEMQKKQLEKKLNKNSLHDIEQPEDLCQLMESSSDPSAFQELMSADQRELLQNFCLRQNDQLSRELSEKIEQQLKKEKLNKRNVSEFLKVKIVDLRKPDYNNPAVLSIWNPNEEVLRLFSEGKAISVMNISIGSCLRAYKPLQINTTRQTQYRQITRNIKYPARQLTSLKDVSSKFRPLFEEVDLVGVVTRVQDVSHGSKLTQIVYITDLEFNFVGILFWGLCKVNEHSIFTENPKHPHLKEEIGRLKSKVPQDFNSFLSKCEEELRDKLEDEKWRTSTSNNSLRNVNGLQSKPTASSTPIKPFPTSLTSSEAEPSPIQKRIEKLQSYGEPPPLLPLIVADSVGKLKKTK